MAILIGALFTALLTGTRLGLNTRAVIMNETLAQGLGIDSGRVRLRDLRNRQRVGGGRGGG